MTAYLARSDFAPSPRRYSPAEATADQLRVALVASDPVTRDGAAAYLHSCPNVQLVPPAQMPSAEVGLVLATRVTRQTIVSIQNFAQRRSDLSLPVVLVADSITEPALANAIGQGLVSFLPRAQTTLDQVVRVALVIRTGRADLPPELVRHLIDQVREFQRQSPGSEGSIGLRLTEREIEVLRLLAEGMETAEVATRLNYSERTIKSVLHTLSARLNLRNRVHAVAYAIRAGEI